jgi:hypothetical protein
MATGSGKTLVMAMVIAWHILNRVANSQDSRFSKHVLVVAPGHHRSPEPCRPARSTRGRDLRAVGAPPRPDPGVRRPRRVKLRLLLLRRLAELARRPRPRRRPRAGPGRAGPRNAPAARRSPRPR